MPTSRRQEVLNVVLAQLLQDRGVVAAPESITYAGTDQKRQMPDVIVNFQGLRTAIEGEIAGPQAREKAAKLATHRVETGVSHIGIGVVYPASLRETDFAQLKHELAHATLEIGITTESGEAEFHAGDINYLERALRSTFEQLIKEDVVAQAVALLDNAIDFFTGYIGNHEGIISKITFALSGLLAPKDYKKLTLEQKLANVRIGGLVLMNAMIFQDNLASNYAYVPTLATIPADQQHTVLGKTWQYILDEINYYSIFHLALEILQGMSPTAGGVKESIGYMVKTARQIGEKSAALRHDLMGRVYHRLLSEAKYLGTYYTSIPAATLLLKLALRPSGWDTNWADLKQVGDLKVADLACGTGTLLMAAADTLIDNYVNQASATGKKVQLSKLHQSIAESILYGYDVLPSAIHLTASTLALRSPDVPFKKMNLFALPHGGKGPKLGSLEFLSGNLVQMPLDLSGAYRQEAPAEQVTGKGKASNYTTLPDLDLCVMNPPFVRSVGGNLLFGSMPDADRAKMQTRLKDLVKKSKVKANITAGLGSVFVAIGDRAVKEGGRLALVLPKALLSGVSWEETRQLINAQYRIDYVIVSHDAERWNFSDSTDLSEVLLVATKQRNHRNGHRTTIVNLWHNPTTALEALAVVAELDRKTLPDLVEDQGAVSLMLDKTKMGEAVTLSHAEMLKDWFMPCAFAQTDLTRAAYHLINGRLFLPGQPQHSSLQLCSLRELGQIGPDRRDIHDGFEVQESPTPYPTFWGHDAKAILTLSQRPNQFLQTLSTPKKGRNLRKVTDLWPLAGNVLIAERMWLKTQRLVAVHLSEPVLSNVWWSFAFNAVSNVSHADKALVLWLNSTLGLTVLFATRDETRGAWVDFKKPSLGAMPVLDIRALTDDQRTRLAEAYDRICEKELLPFPQMAEDGVRAEIDAAIAEVLGLPDLSVLRRMLGREPVVCMKRL